MNQTESEWKFVIKLDITALRIRFEQLQEYLKNTGKRCAKVIAENTQQIYANMVRILEKENIQLITTAVKNIILQYK